MDNAEKADAPTAEVVGVPKKGLINWNTFMSSVFFVLGFSLVFSIVGVLLQTVLSAVGYSVQAWLGRIGGVIIILFGLYLVGLIHPAFLEKEHKISVKHKFSSRHVTSFVFGAAFAVGWTPCVGAALGAILALATTAASSAFILMVAYTLGLGIPFLIVGLFADQATRWVAKGGRWLRWLQIIFGVLLIAIGILVFTSQLSRVANLQFMTDVLSAIGAGTSLGSGIGGLSIVNLGVAFFAGVVSFLSPCVLPLIPGFLAYLASTGVKKDGQ